MKADWSLTEAFLASYPRDAARVVEHAGAESSAAVLCRCSPRVISGTLRQMDPQQAARVLACLPAEMAPDVLSELPLGAAALVLRFLDPSQRERLLAPLPEETARPLRTALSYPEGTAGSMMDLNVSALPSEISVGEARRRVRRRSKQTGSHLYLVDEDRRVVGVISLRELFLASPRASLASLMRSPVERVVVEAGLDTILAHSGWRGLHALPVVDSAGILVGILRRETYERLREELAGQGAAGGSGFGLELAEMLWTLTASAIDELERAARPEANSRPAENRDDD